MFCRWALVKDRGIAQKMTKFIELNTIGVSKDSQLRAAKVLKAVSDGYELPAGTKPAHHRLFDFGRHKMVERWSMLREAAAASGIFSLPEETSDHCNFTKEMAATNPGTVSEDSAIVYAKHPGCDCMHLI
jgi:L-tryptophan---pyruvate aminotransferase